MRKQVLCNFLDSPYLNSLPYPIYINSHLAILAVARKQYRHYYHQNLL